jgi:hypothetical protein
MDHTLDLSTNIAFDRGDGLACLGTQRTMETLILDNCPLTSLHTVPAQPRLKVLSANHLNLESLLGLRQVKPPAPFESPETFQNLANISMVGAPVSLHENFRLTALILLPKLSKINGRVVTPHERRIAQAYPPIARELVTSGWFAAYPPPSADGFRELAAHFRIECTDTDIVATSPLSADPVSPDGRGPAAGRFSDRIARILAPLGFEVRSGPSRIDDIGNAVDTLCAVIEKMERIAAGGDEPQEPE